MDKRTLRRLMQGRRAERNEKVMVNACGPSWDVMDVGDYDAMLASRAVVRCARMRIKKEESLSRCTHLITPKCNRHLPRCLSPSSPLHSHPLAWSRAVPLIHHSLSQPPHGHRFLSATSPCRPSPHNQLHPPTQSYHGMWTGPRGAGAGAGAGGRQGVQARALLESVRGGGGGGGWGRGERVNDCRKRTAKRIPHSTLCMTRWWKI
jgi:hypothetical protein